VQERTRGAGNCVGFQQVCVNACIVPNHRPALRCMLWLHAYCKSRMCACRAVPIGTCRMTDSAHTPRVRILRALHSVSSVHATFHVPVHVTFHVYHSRYIPCIRAHYIPCIPCTLHSMYSVHATFHVFRARYIPCIRACYIPCIPCTLHVSTDPKLRFWANGHSMLTGARCSDACTLLESVGAAPLSAARSSRSAAH
jgi:hypothetical protein